jgi:hypothetical protein
MTNLRRRPGAAAWVVALVCAGGCTAGGATTGTVTGEVTLDGQPLKAGLIKFVPADGLTPTADATIADGKFTAKVPVGQKRVEISASKVVGKQKMYDTPDSPVVEQTAELLPSRYNVRSELTITVKAGTQTERFELQSK